MKFERVSVKTYQDSLNSLQGIYPQLEKASPFPSAPYPSRADDGSVGYDIFSPCEFKLKPGEEIIIPTGYKIQLDSRVGLFIFPRSGQGFNYFSRLANTVGIIDPRHYNNSENEGHFLVKIRNESADRLMEVNLYQAFCQGVLIPFLITDDDNAPPATNQLGGFGSSNR